MPLMVGSNCFDDLFMASNLMFLDGQELPSFDDNFIALTWKL